MPDFHDKFELLKKGLKSFEFYDSSNSALNLEGLVDEDIMEKRHVLFLGIYSENEISNALKRFGIIQELEEKGFQNIKVKLKIEDPFHQEVLIYDEEETPESLLSHFIAREGIIKPKKDSQIPGKFKDCRYEVIIIEWLSMQNPRATFTREKPKLPGQRYPGLGVGEKVIEMLYTMAINLEKDGILNFPEFFHNAQLYWKPFMFYDPVTEGIFEAMIRDLNADPHSLSDKSYAIFFDCLIHRESGKIFKWFREELIAPVSEKLKKYYEFPWFKDTVLKTASMNHFYIDWEKFKRIKNNKNIYEVV